MEKTDLKRKKTQIYFARTYRHLKVNRWESVIFLSLFVLPVTILLLLYYDELTWMISRAGAWLINLSADMQTQFSTDSFIPKLGEIHYLILPTIRPDYKFVLVNLIIVLILVWFFSVGPKKGKPIAIYFTMLSLVHTMACIFFLIGRGVFSYTLEDYSNLYIKQQVGIWITFLVLMGLVMGILGQSGIIWRVLTVLSVICYSILFGLVRYVLFMYILYNFSILYMPLMFFALGPFFDFLYFVAIYSISINRMIHIYNSKQKGKWIWA